MLLGGKNSCSKVNSGAVSPHFVRDEAAEISSFGPPRGGAPPRASAAAMRHVRSSLLLVAVALAAALGVWAALSVLVPRGAEPRAPAESSGQSQGLAVDAAATLSDAGSAPALAAPDETAEVDSTAAEILQQQQLAAYGRAQPQRAGTDGGTGGSSVGGGSGVADTIGEAAGALRPSQYHGVVWSPPTQNWKAQYAVESTKNGGSGRTLDLGYFENEEQAAYAYDEAARRRGNGYAPNYALNFPTTERGFVADEILLPSRQKCARVPPDEPLRRPGIGQQLSSSDCAFMPLARPEPYLSHQLALLTDVIATLNKSLAPAARMPVMPWAGSLLGAYRDGDLIPWTSDGDVTFEFLHNLALDFHISCRETDESQILSRQA